MSKVIYDLECEYGHRFEGWFRSLKDYETQREQRMLCCPECHTANVRKVPSKVNLVGAPASGPKPGLAEEEKNQPEPSDLKVATAFVIAEQVMHALVKHSEDVGSNFVEEVRKIYYEEAPPRAIRGEASFEEFEELRDEGIDIIALPPGHGESLN